MVLQETFGEFDSAERLRNVVKLICQLPGTYEVLIKASNGEEGILHCSGDTIRNAAYRNLSGMQALAEIVSWTSGKYWLEELPVLPVRTLNLSLDQLFAEADHLIASRRGGLPSSESKVIESEEVSKTVIPEFGEVSKESGFVKEEIPEPGEKIEAGLPIKEPPVFVREPESKPREAKEDRTSKVVEASDISQRIAALKGVNGVIMTSIDGMLISALKIEPTDEEIQVVALMGEALEQTGELFSKGRLVHGAVDVSAQRILVHPFRQSYIGTIIGSTVSAAVVGAEIERLISEEAGR